MSYDTKASFVLSFVFDAGDKLASLRGETFELESFGLRPKVCHFCFLVLASQQSISDHSLLQHSEKKGDEHDDVEYFDVTRVYKKGPVSDAAS